MNTVNDTTSRITVTAALEDKYAAQYGTHYDVIVNGVTYRSRDVLLNNYGNWATRDAVTFTVDVGRGASGWNCSVQIHVYGKTYNNYYGSAGGDAWATEHAWIQRGYSQPHHQESEACSRFQAPRTRSRGTSITRAWTLTLGLACTSIDAPTTAHGSISPTCRGT